MKELLEKLDSFLTLPDNWNGYGAFTLSSDVIDFTKDKIIPLFDRNNVSPSVSPSTTGGILISFVNEYYKFNIEIDDPELIEVGFRSHDLDITGEIKGDLRFLEYLINKLND